MAAWSEILVYMCGEAKGIMGAVFIEVVAQSQCDAWLTFTLSGW
jgi:hypothetical protein